MFYNVIQIRRKPDGSFMNNVYSELTENDAKQRFFAGLSTYAFDENFDYVAYYIIASDGRCIKQEIIDRRINEELE